MEKVFIKNKQEYFDENYIFQNPPKLTDKMYCIHCGQIITVGDYKVYRADNGFEFICCPNAPDCDGTLIDWIEPDNLMAMDDFSLN